jgi:hypothetical protein
MNMCSPVQRSVAVHGLWKKSLGIMAIGKKCPQEEKPLGIMVIGKNAPGRNVPLKSLWGSIAPWSEVGARLLGVTLFLQVRGSGFPGRECQGEA